ncbi:unnamed protein product [Prorocentrum cordatum]|uniref:Uncharacterized protein n=1 Tax=Prorocentrum cordatum TaxID=2364126 RepID=A0ABN9W0W2_9DINO|nr:unnamed protein product [Polarella glacialis]
MGKTLSSIAAEEAEEELCEATGIGASSEQCAEHNMFRNWQANAAADELLDVESLLRASEPPPPPLHGGGELGEAPAGAEPAASPAGAAAGGDAAGAVQPPVMQEVAHAMCEMCLEPHHRDSEKCASFKGVTSCGEAHEEGKLTEWATGVEELQADLRRKVEESKAHHAQLERLHPSRTVAWP